MNDALRAAILSLTASTFPLLQIAGVFSFTGDEVAAIQLFIGNFLTMLAFIIKSGQQSG